ncbi:MerC domain-containing protein [Sandarakinorhabdus sp. AAP62]|uniref:MerC domain-containing protein n=1 Tax=Sandarakinorhabdus sp. AAP62 TaxID=1248916 RepID=UPI00030EBC58|nr:MerC domain-containing protein [Sandarakinorhabdus sp. AAP62]
MSEPPASLLDRIAIGLSGLCLLHCMAGFVLLSLFALSGDWLDHRVHVVGLVMAMPLAAVALWRGWRRHGRLPIGLLGAAGLVVMAASLLVVHGDVSEMLASMVGVSLLAFAHWQNMKALRTA